MKKLPIVLCLIFLSLALFNARVYAVFVTDITGFIQDNRVGGSFRDTFVDGVEPPSGPSGASTYLVEGTFVDGDETGSKLRLDSTFGVVDIDNDRIISAALNDSTEFFSTSAGQSVIGTFDFTGGHPAGTFFGIEIINFASSGGEISGDPATDDEAWMDIFSSASGDKWLSYGDEDDMVGSQNITAFIIGNTIGLKLEIDGLSNVSALLDFNLDDIYDLTIAGFTQLTFNQTLGVDDVYTGGFSAGEELTVVPEPATIALLGIGLAGLAGAVVRRRFKIERT